MMQNSKFITYIKSKIFKVIITSLVIALILSGVITLNYKNENFYQCNAVFAISTNSDVHSSTNDNLVINDLDYFKEKILCNGEVALELLYSDYLKERIDLNRNIVADGAKEEAIIKGELSQSGKVVKVNTFSNDKSACEQCISAIIDNYDILLQEKVDCSAVLLNKVDEAFAATEIDDALKNDIVAVNGHNYLKQSFLELAISAIKPFLMCFSASIIFMIAIHIVTFSLKECKE